MPITIKGAFSVGETIKQAPPQPVENKNLIHNKLATFQQIKAPLVEEKPVKVNKPNIITRKVPVRNVEPVKVDKYKYVEEGELIKQFNRKSSYLNDMIQTEEIK